MSIKVMTDVWANSQHSGGSLLILLAIADFADDNGYAYPGQDTLATKSRLSRRQVGRIIQSLIKSGELNVDAGRSHVGTFIYQIRCDKMSHATLASQNDTSNVTFMADDVTPMSHKPLVLKPSANKENRQYRVNQRFSKKKDVTPRAGSDWDEYVRTHGSGKV